MRIGFNMLGLLPDVIGGVETYVRGLLAGLTRIDADNEYVIFTNRDNHATFDGFGRNFSRVLYDFSAAWTVPALAMTRILGEQLYLPFKANREGIDVLHSPLDITPLFARCPTVMTLHDLNFDAVPEATTPARRLMAKLLVKTSARRAHAIVTVSSFSRHQIVSQLGVDPDRVSVTYNAVNPHRSVLQSRWPNLANRLAITKPYIIAFSSLNLHKNIAKLLHAFARLGTRDRWQLVVVGHLPRHGPQLRQLASTLGLGDSVVFTGYLSRDDLELALQHARVMAFPSLYEGFGIPVLEAMNASVPVACSNVAALPEIAADAALFFDPLSVGSMAVTIERLLTDDLVRERLVAAGHENVKRFSWEQTARRTLEVYRRVTDSGTDGRQADAEAA